MDSTCSENSSDYFYRNNMGFTGIGFILHLLEKGHWQQF